MTFKNMDAAMSAFFENELRQVMARSYDVVYPELHARTMFPVSSEISSGAESFVYDQYDFVGVAKLIHSYASDLPSVEVTGKQFVRQVWSEGISFKYSFQDVRAAQFANRPLNDRKAKAARRQMLSLENKIAFHGDAEAGIPGFIQYPNILQEDASGAWNDSDVILADLETAIARQRDVTFGAESANILVVPDEYYVYMAMERFNTYSDMSLLEYIVQKFPFIEQVVSCYELKGSDPAGKDCAMLYRKDPEKLTMEIPQDVEFFDAQQDGFMFKVPVHARTAGVVVYAPLSVIRIDNIGNT